MVQSTTTPIPENPELIRDHRTTIESQNKEIIQLHKSTVFLLETISNMEIGETVEIFDEE